ncbi:anaphase-promoting complex protein [Lindgomyces ingoldianus]|uniref:Anaphase-promoting complex protein n=1 Tax=Lindgomyces ingoldianus TaxID=673940 RepID=A0ACB6RG41_9PLEO|nr:anaphase-promoting complex protein [Lindgomyces ingoldianus]KAF2477277.1 anaphase-promoting complex protein [Lindgomyces ingoldianus]
MASSRYLTPQKISLLVLVKLYCNSVLPSSATIPILSFILSHSIPPLPSHARARHTSGYQDYSISIRAFEDVLQGQPSSMPGRTLLDVFLKQMWELNSFDALHNLFNHLGCLLARTREDSEQNGGAGDEEDLSDHIVLSKSSPLGTIVRRARLEFTRLQFDDSIKLWSAFIMYRAPTAQWTKRIAGLASSGIDINAVDMELGPGDPLYEVAYGHLEDEDSTEENLSIDDLNRLLEFQLDQLQRLGCRVPEDMKKRLQNMLGPFGAVLRQSHLVKFFDAWKAGDYTSAFDSLHRYYDYAMQTREKVHYQYALLHMAILQADFGCFGEAIAAINETIATARENQDMTCLNFSLSWLNHMSKAYPRQMKGAGYMGMLGSERDGLIFLKAKARETKMHNLLSATLLNEAKLSLSTGESIPRALEYMYQASHLNIRENVNNNGGSMLLHSTLYSRLGLTHLSSVYCELLLHCYRQTSPIDEKIRAICRCAFAAVQTGCYDEGLDLLENIDSSDHRSLKFHQYIYHCTGIINLKRAIRRTDWTACEHLLSSLKPDSSTDPELSFLLCESRIDYLISRGLYSEAFNAIEDQASSLKEENADILQRTAMLLAKGVLFCKVGKPERGFSVALRAASVAFKARLMPSLWMAVGVLCCILNALGEYEGSGKLLHAVIPQALENADKALIASLYSSLGDSFIGLAGLDDPTSSNGARSLAAKVSRAELFIDRARECYKRVEDTNGECEQLMKKALLAKLRGDETLAEEWAQNHNRVWEEGRKRIVDGK